MSRLLAAASCNPIVCSSDGPHTPFGTWYLIIFDTLRVVAIVACLGLIFLTVTAWSRSVSHGGQRDRYAALGIFAAVVAGTSAQNIGNIGSYRLFLSAIGVALALRGLWRFRHEQPAKPGQ